jgi:hypothetical protein
MSMKIQFALVIVCLAVQFSLAQTAMQNHKFTQADEAAVQEWLKNLYEIGVVVENDTFIVREEARLAATDSLLRSIVYAHEYNWANAQYLLKQMHIKIGLWHLINLYLESETNRPAVLKYIISLDGVFDMQKALTASFYTYIFFDPAAGTLVNGKPVINRPDILDEKLIAVRDMTAQVMAHR